MTTPNTAGSTGTATTKVWEPRRYQTDILDYVTERNGIIFLPTGSGKTYIAFLALKRFSNQMQETIANGGKRALFMCNTVELARQQANELKKFINLKVGLYVGERNVDDWTRSTWEKEIAENQVLVGTAQIFVDIVNQNYIKITDLSIVVMDECHHATGGHPMRQFLSFFQHADQTRLPRVIGLTGVLLKGNKLSNIEKDLKALEATFRGNIVTVSNMEEYHNVMVYSTKPLEQMICFSDMKHTFQLEANIITQINNACSIVDAWDLGNIPPKLTKGLGQLREPNKKNYVKNLLKDFLYQMNDFGLYAASIAIMSVIIELEIKKHQAETMSLRNMYRSIVTQSERIRHLLVNKLKDEMDDDMSGDGGGSTTDTRDVILNFSTPKMRSLLMYVMSKFVGKQPDDISCLVFVERRYSAKCVYYVLKKFIDVVPELRDVLRPQFMVGRSTICPSIKTILERKWNKDAIDKFRNKECNLIVCSNVLEEGIDIQACNYVFVVDPLKTFSSYIQTKGRARSNESIYAIFAPKLEEHKVVTQLRNYQQIHDVIKKFLIGRILDREDPREEEIAAQFQTLIPPFVIPSGARLNAESALQLLARYCQALPMDVFGVCSPWFTKMPRDAKGDSLVSLKLPLQSTVKETILSGCFDTTKMCKISAAFKACVRLYENGELNEKLLPITKRECVAKVSEIFFKHWEKYRNNAEAKYDGGKQHRRMYARATPPQLYAAMPVVGAPCYAYAIRITPDFVVDEYNAHIAHLLQTSSNYAIFVNKPLPALAQMPLFMTPGRINVQIDYEPKVLRLQTPQQLEELRVFHTMLFRELLPVWKEFFVMDRRNQENAFLLTPMRAGVGADIDWSLVHQFQHLLPLREYSTAERARKQYRAEDYLGKVVNTWYSVNTNERFVVTKVLADQTPDTAFPSGHYRSYADFVQQKYDAQIVHRQQFLIEVKALTSRRNFFINAKGKSQKGLQTRQQARIVLIPELCHNFMFPGDMWLKALLLPSIMHRVTYMLHAEELRLRINTFLGIGRRAYTPKPLIIDESLKRVTDVDGNAVDAQEESQKLLPALPTVKPVRQEPYFEVRSLVNIDAGWKEYMEPQNIQDHYDAVYPVEIDYYHKFVNGLAGELDALRLEDAEEYTNAQLNKQKPKKFSGLAAVAAAATAKSSPLRSIAAVPLEDRRRLKILELSLGSGNNLTQLQSAEQCEFVAALTTAAANDVFDMERFEVLGDSFLKFAISLFLMHKYPKWNEGFLTEVKSKFVSNRNLLYCMLELNISGTICAAAFKPKCDWLPPAVSIPTNLLQLLQQQQQAAKPLLRHVAPGDLYAIEVSEAELLSGVCESEQLERFVNSCSKHTIESNGELLMLDSDVHSFLYKQQIADKVLADTLEAVLGVCVKNYGIQQSFRMLRFFGICAETEGLSLTQLLALNLGSPLLRTNITQREVDGFLINYPKLEENLGYKFRDRAYLLQALTHPSYPTNRLTGCYQQLEFIGDAILDFLVSCYIYERCEHMNPGKLTDLRSALVNNITLSCICVRHRFHLFMLSENSVLSEAIRNFAEFQEKNDHCVTDAVRILMEESDAMLQDQSFNMSMNIDVPKALGDVVEALIAAVYLDSRDLRVTWHVVYGLLEQEFEQFMCDVPIDAVRQLYEFKGADPKFSDALTDKEVVMVKCSFTCLNERHDVHGFGSNKKNAKKSAAKHALQILSKH